MATTQLFKNTAKEAHRKRYMTNENDFSKGMQYTNKPLDTGYAKSIVNFDLKNDGASLAPRGGLRTIASKISYSSSLLSLNDGYDYYVHHSGTMFVSDWSGFETYLCNYFLLCRDDSPDYYGTGGHVSSAVLVIEYNGNYIRSTYDNTVSILRTHFRVAPKLKSIHGLNITDSKARHGIYASLEGVTYIPVTDFIDNPDTQSFATGDYLAKIVAKFEPSMTSFKWHIERVTPYEVQPTQAMNYGYNMLKDDPYTFTNTVSATGAIQLTGVLPYDEAGNLLLTARAGTPMVFKLFYKYPQTDLDNSDKYLVQWEVQDLNSNSNAEVIKKVRDSVEYTPGSDITFAYTPTYKAFSIIVRLYKKSEITAQDAAWEADQVLQKLITKDDNLTPNQVTTLASYYLTGASDTSMLNIKPETYYIPKATGMCVWQQRLVFWGVERAKNILFVSEINNPAYIPYPNNCEIFNDDIVCAISYMSSLLVFTNTALYKLTFNDDGLTYNTECVQERLNMIASDVNTVLTVQNMVYFKSGNYFYMVVPNNKLTSQTGIQLAPISRAVEYMFDNLYKTFTDIITEVYGITYLGRTDDIQLQLIDFNVQVANTQIRNVYKVKIVTQDLYGNDPVDVYFDISLNYDTVLRAWTIYVNETNIYRDCIYKCTVTGENILIHLYNEERVADLYYVLADLIQADSKNPQDDIAIIAPSTWRTEKATYNNWQFIDTGYRVFSEDLKKRFREIQFCVNIFEDTVLKFNTAFVVDDVEHVPMYKNVIERVTDASDPNYGVIFVERALCDTVNTPELSILGDWELDTAAFPGITMHKVRYKVSGKGYGGAVKIISKNSVPFELIHINWVYRLMFGR